MCRKCPFSSECTMPHKLKNRVRFCDYAVIKFNNPSFNLPLRDDNGNII